MASCTNTLVFPSDYERNGSPAIISPSAGSTSIKDAISYAQLAIMTRSLQRDLARIGITKDSRIALVLPNGLEFAVILLAIIRQRGIAAPLNPQYTQSEFRDIFSQMKLDLVVMLPEARGPGDSSYMTDPAFLAAQQLGLHVALCYKKSVLQDGDGQVLELALRPHEITNNHCAPVAVDTGAAIFSRDEVLPEDKVVMLSTSGTTGAPKLVLLSHTNLLTAMRIIIANHQLSSSDRTMIITPLYHIIGLCGSLLATLFSGGCAVIPYSLPGAFWQRCADYGITWFHAVPTLHQLLLNFSRPGGRVSPHLRFIRSGGSEISPDLYERLVALGPPLLEVYGMTETAPAIFCNRWKEGNMRRRSHFPIPDAVDVMILPSTALGQGSDGEDALINTLTKAPGIVGEVCVLGQNVMEGYVENPQANGEAFLPNGYFRTGDLGNIEPGGYLKLVGRKKEVINKGGEKIGPAEIEHVALSHELVSGAACFRIADNMYGDEIGLAVSLMSHKAGSPLVASELKHHIGQHLTQFKVPREIVFVDIIPYNPTGKPMRTQLSQQFAKGLL
ncbi:putative NRPS-like protein biosynthetic cluster [Trichoderma atroviride]|uniref:CoA synthetase n=1 Tax=Hypocrea atroviridis (strain ATCC 20476 / IMI 206040) TaxID=452589 RepID=G9NZ21_HYPAI|nr:CoA synthetase [Trichoderma atroviride IMI 206040]EHK44572.1 CoA synthetase [Trichoderma atroviride IMI 206040]UKZ67973.1 putative NRPS-like protein biosynthetic cluster [Trichoderma atroviride]